MSSNQVEIKFMVSQLLEWNNKLGGSESSAFFPTQSGRWLLPSSTTCRRSSSPSEPRSLRCTPTGSSMSTACGRRWCALT